MDSLQGIPVEYRLDAFNMPCTGTTLCHPKICYVYLTRNPALDTLAPISPLGNFNGDQRTPLHQTDKNHGDSKTQSLTRTTTHAAISTFSTFHNAISSQYSQPFTSLAAPKANPIFHTANKNLFIKIYFDLRHLTSSSSYFYFSQPSEGTNNTKRGNNKLGEETTQRKHTCVTPSPSQNTNFPSLLTKQILQLKSPYKYHSYKIVPPRYQQLNPVHK